MNSKFAGSSSETQTMTSNDMFPRRICKSGFPHQPSQEGGKLANTIENVTHLLAESGVEVRYDTIKKVLSVSRIGEALSPSTLDGLANLNGLQSRFFSSFVQEIGSQNPCNPVAAWIESSPWDGVSRVPAICATVQVDGEFPDGLKDKLVLRWLYSAVAAATMGLGFKARGVLTLQGEQGIGKTSWIAALAPPNLRNSFIKLDHHLDPHCKDSVYIGVSHWITEIGELDSSFRKDIARLKGFLTNDCDKLRLPYDARPRSMDRKTVFAASVNDPNFLIDRTGNSRWWTLPVVALDYDHSIDMQQLYAELLQRVEAGEQWWLTPAEEAELENSNHRFRAVSVIEERLLEHLSEAGTEARYQTAIEVLKIIGVNYPTNPQCKEVGQILRTMYGAPKRVQGRNKWKVPLVEERGWSKTAPAEQDNDDDDDDY